jgi:Raf kinase inhibitor-like YbhB/YbcL family protein
MNIEVHGFGNGDAIPAQYSKLGGNRSPAMSFHDVPGEARSLVLIVDDPDAPRGLFTHWVVYNIDPRLGAFDENSVPEIATQGKNSWGEDRYGGPQPPDREHRYFFRLYALDTPLTVGRAAERRVVEREMEGHVIAEAEYMGRYAPHTAELAGRH